MNTEPYPYFSWSKIQWGKLKKKNEYFSILTILYNQCPLFFCLLIYLVIYFYNFQSSWLQEKVIKDLSYYNKKERKKKKPEGGKLFYVCSFSGWQKWHLFPVLHTVGRLQLQRLHTFYMQFIEKAGDTYL